MPANIEETTSDASRRYNSHVNLPFVGYFCTILRDCSLSDIRRQQGDEDLFTCSKWE